MGDLLTYLVTTRGGQAERVQAFSVGILPCGALVFYVLSVSDLRAVRAYAPGQWLTFQLEEAAQTH